MKKITLLTILILMLLSCSLVEKEEEESNTTIKSEKINPIGGEAVGNGETTISELKSPLDFNN